jgi:hypothetical protein
MATDKITSSVVLNEKALDDLIVKSYWNLRLYSMLKLEDEQTIAFKDAYFLHSNLLTYYSQLACRAIYTNLEKRKYFTENIEPYLYTIKLFPKLKKQCQYKTLQDFGDLHAITIYGSRCKKQSLAKGWETYPESLVNLSAEEVLDLNKKMLKEEK